MGGINSQVNHGRRPEIAIVDGQQGTPRMHGGGMFESRTSRATHLARRRNNPDEIVLISTSKDMTVHRHVDLNGSQDL